MFSSVNVLSLTRFDVEAISQSTSRLFIERFVYFPSFAEAVLVKASCSYWGILHLAFSVIFLFFFSYKQIKYTKSDIQLESMCSVYQCISEDQFVFVI